MAYLAEKGCAVTGAGIIHLDGVPPIRPPGSQTHTTGPTEAAMAIHVCHNPPFPDFANRAGPEKLDLYSLYRALRKEQAPLSRREEYR